MNGDKQEEHSKPATLATLDLPEIVSLVRRKGAQRDLPTPLPDLALRRLGGPVAEIELSRASVPPALLQLQRDETRLPLRIPKLYPVVRQPVATALRQVDRDTYRVLMAPLHGTVQPVELHIPAGLQRFVNVATLKAMLSANPRDLVFRKTEGQDRWAVCPDEYPVDLEDRRQIFKIREWAILS